MLFLATFVWIDAVRLPFSTIHTNHLMSRERTLICGREGGESFEFAGLLLINTAPLYTNQPIVSADKAAQMLNSIN